MALRRIVDIFAVTLKQIIRHIQNSDFIMNLTKNKPQWDIFHITLTEQDFMLLSKWQHRCLHWLQLD